MTTPFPFKILGTSDDGQVCFLDGANRFKQTPSRSLNKSFLISLAQIEYWRDEYKHHTASDKSKDPVDWDRAISNLIQLSEKDFDINNTKGIGAWRSKEGELCYHNGNPSKIMGKKPKDWVFIRKASKDIGLNAPHTPLEIRTEILNVALSLAFATPRDAIMVLSWATIAPFSGPLPWRCSGIITGATGGGKSAIIEKLLLPLTGETTLFLSGSSTEAGVRQKTHIDSRPVIIEEFEATTPREIENRNAVLGLMRQSTTDNTPEVVKGGKDGNSQSFRLKCMFLFSAISAQVSNTADENRLFFCNVKSSPPGGDKNWPKNQAALKRLMVKENMDGIRSLIWSKLPTLIDNIGKLELMIQEETKLSSRQATAEAPLLAVYMMVWLGMEEINRGQARSVITKFYDGYEAQKRDENDETIQKLLDIIVQITETRESFTVRELLVMVNLNKRLDDEGEDENGNPNSDKTALEDRESQLPKAERDIYKKKLLHCGVVLAPTGKFGAGAIGIAKDHNFIMEKLHFERGYQKQLVRHDKCIDKSYPITVNSIQKGYMIFGEMI